MRATRAAVAFGAGYLAGSLSFARVVGRFVTPDEDLSVSNVELPGGARLDYGGVSATSISVRGGPQWGVLTGLLDSAKAFVPTLLAKRAWPGEPYYAFTAAGAVAGHNWPIFHQFKGGRGQTPFYGGLAAMDWVAIPVTTAAGSFIGVVLVRDMLAAYSIGMWLTIPWLMWRKRPAEVAYAIAGNVMFTIAMIPETKGYLALRRSGELQSMSSWREFLSSYPAMRRSGSGDDS